MNTFEIKNGNNAKDLQMMTPKMFMVWAHFLSFTENEGLPVRITNIKHKFKVSKSNTHPEGRAVDVSVKKWTNKNIEECIDYMFLISNHMGAISFKTGLPKVIHFHDAGLGHHLHLQVSR